MGSGYSGSSSGFKPHNGLMAVVRGLLVATWLSAGSSTPMYLFLEFKDGVGSSSGVISE